MCAKVMSWSVPHAQLPKYVALFDLPHMRPSPLGALLLDVGRAPPTNAPFDASGHSGMMHRAADRLDRNRRQGLVFGHRS